MQSDHPTTPAAPIEPPPGDRLPIDADRDDIAAILMANWGVADNDEAAYDSACADFDAIVAAEFRIIHAAAAPLEPLGDRQEFAALVCSELHTMIWPSDLMPFPATCLSWISDPEGQCGAALHDTGKRFVEATPTPVTPHREREEQSDAQ